MKKSSNIFYFSILLISLTSFISCSKKNQNKKMLNDTRSKEIIVYAYDSFVSEWGPGSEIERLFEEETDYDLTLINCGNAVQVLSRAILEKNNVQADVVLGLDNNIAVNAIKENILLSYKPKNADVIVDKNINEQLSKEWFLSPFDYSHFAMIYDTNSNIPCPQSLDDLLKPIYKGKIILMDPRTSTPGLGFLSWTVAVYGDKVIDYWKALKPNILTMAPSWSTGYGLFKKGEAPLVISYTTSPASHIEYDNTEQYIAAIFDQGHPIQVEGVGILKNAPNTKGAKDFIDFLLSIEAQSILPLTQWMNPVNQNVELPDCYKKASPIPTKTLSVEPDITNEALEKIMTILGN